jgi:hypothetical protein
MVKRNDKTNTGEGVKTKKGRTVSDDAGGKSLSDTSTSKTHRDCGFFVTITIVRKCTT